MDKQKQQMSKIKIAYTVEVHKKAHVTPASPQPTSQSVQMVQSQYASAMNPPSGAMFDNFGDLEDNSLMGWSQYSSSQPISQVSFPCTFTLEEMVTMELMAVHAVGKNIPAIKVQCGNFYHVTPVRPSPSPPLSRSLSRCSSMCIGD